MPNEPNSGPRSVSILVEFENAKTICRAEIREALLALTSEVQQFRSLAPERAVELIAVHSGPPADSEPVRRLMAEEAPELLRVATVMVRGLPTGRYYELKNLAIAEASGDVVVLLDSDTVAEAGWLETLLRPFHRPETVAANGYTYLRHRDLVSRAIALFWFFPVRERDAKGARRRALNANNCAFRRGWLQANPFPRDNGFKVGCTLLTHRLRAQGIEIVQTEARAGHQPLRGWRFLLWRALVTGRDADRKYALLKSPSPLKRCVNAMSFFYKMERRAVSRVLTLHRRVELPPAQVPAAMALGMSFYAVSFVGQTLRAIGLASDRPEVIPPYAEHT